MLRRIHAGRSRARIRPVLPVLWALLLVSGCDDDNEVLAPVSDTGIVAGTVFARTGEPVPEALVSIGADTTTAGPDGRFELTGLTPGQAMLHCSAPGFTSLQEVIVITTGRVERDLHMARVETEASVEGTVRLLIQSILAESTHPLEGIEVTVGAVTATTDADGHYELTGLTPGAATLRATGDGYDTVESPIELRAGSRLRHDVEMSRIELFQLGRDFALYVPASTWEVRGVLVALGGPNTRAFATGAPIGVPIPELEESLQTLGRELRAMAESHGLAVLGTSRLAMSNGPESDQLILDALREAGAMSGRPELADAPLLVYGMGSGGPQASGFVARTPDRAVGLFLKVPTGVEALAMEDALGVPTYVVLAELDAFVDNALVTAAVRANRSRGALWALAEERGVPHHSLSPRQRTVTLQWMRTIVDLRLGPLGEEVSDPPRAMVESSGWLGDPATGAASAWATFAGDARSGSWLPTRGTAVMWRAFLTDVWPQLTIDVFPETLTLSSGEYGWLKTTVWDDAGNRILHPIVSFSPDREDVVSVVVDHWGERDWRYLLGVAPGEATITAEFGGATSVLSVTVVP